MICDGCGAQANDQHTRERIERLELATHFRPIHIQVLLIDPAPPQRLEDYFYRLSPGGSLRSAASQRYFDELCRGTGAASSSGGGEAGILAEFQRKGFFLASAVECPLRVESEGGDAVRRFASMLLRRVQFSYKPKFIGLLTQASRELLGPLREAGWDGRLVLDEDGTPFAHPELGDRLSRVLATLIPAHEPARSPTSAARAARE